MATGGSDPDREGGDRAAEGDPVNKLTCAICLEKFRRPKMLVCFHTFCQSCLQGVAGTSPTLACPSCRTPILLPPGGVSALQTNFYIEEDLDNSKSTPQRRLCDICTEDREAVYTCIQCQQKFCLHCRKYHDSFRSIRGHTVVSLTQEDNDSCQKGGAPSHKSDDKSEPEMCPKHPDQQLLLHCKKCQADICMQCKLTQHEGHPTDDLSDTRARARTRLHDMLGSVTRHRQQVGHLILALTHRRATFHQQQQETQRDFQGRADTLYQWVNQSLEDAVRSVQSTAEELEKPLQDRVEQLQNRDLALQAQQDHMVRVLKDGREADIVSLEAQLNSILLETPDLKQVEKELTKSVPKFHVKHGTSAVNQMQLREFIGVLQPVPPASFPLQSQSAADSTSSTDDDSSQKNTADASKRKPPRELIYSQNPQSSVIAMCPISQNRLWVVYRPAPNAAVLMKLFDADGQVLATVNNAKSCTGLIAITDDTVLSWVCGLGDVQMISSDGGLSTHSLGIKVDHLVPSAANDKQYLGVINDRSLYQVRFSKTEKLTYSVTNILFEKVPTGMSPGHVSCQGEYVTFVFTNVVRVHAKDAKGNCVEFCSFCPPVKSSARDVRFCQVDGQELLLVMVQGDNRVHVVDHTDGGACVRYLDTGTLTLSGPQCLATDSDQHVWIGCKGGKVVMVSL